MLQMMTTLSAMSRITSGSNSFQPSSDITTSICHPAPSNRLHSKLPAYGVRELISLQFEVAQLELATYYAKVSAKGSPSKKVHTWLNTVHGEASAAHMLLDSNTVGELPAQHHWHAQSADLFGGISLIVIRFSWG